MPELEMRPYQADAVDELREAVAVHGSVLYVLPTGGGKTVVAARIAQLAHAKGNRTLFLAHRRELVAQTVDTLSNALPGVNIGVEAAGWPSQPWAPLQVGMVQSIVRRKHTVKPDLVIPDEAHHMRAATWEKVLALWPGVPRIGLTATPERLDGKGLGKHFAHMVFGPSIAELVDEGYLAPIITRTIPSGLALGDVRKTRTGEYRQDDLRKQVGGTVIADAVDAYCTYAMGKRAIFFGIDINHSKSVCERLRDRGVRAEHVDGNDSVSRRDRIMNEFRTGGVDVLGNCDLVSEGLDVPACEVVIMGKPTRSITVFLQSAGRAMRPGEGKVAELLDIAGNSYELGLPDDPREWSLEDGETAERGTSSKPKPKECKKCHVMFRGRQCPNCGEEAALPTKPPVEIETELVTASPGPRRNSKMRRPELNQRLRCARLSKDPIAALHNIAQTNGYKPGWVHHIARVWELE